MRTKLNFKLFQLHSVIVNPVQTRIVDNNCCLMRILVRRERWVNPKREQLEVTKQEMALSPRFRGVSRRNLTLTLFESWPTLSTYQQMLLSSHNTRAQHGKIQRL